MFNLVIDWKKIEIDLMEETVSAEIRPLKPEHMLLLLPYLKEQNAEALDLLRKRVEKIKEGSTLGKEDEQRLSELMLESSTNNLELQKAAIPVYSSVIRNIEGIRINGEPLLPDMLGQEAALCQLAVSLLTKVFIHSNLSKESEKNLPSPSVEKLPGQITDE